MGLSPNIVSIGEVVSNPLRTAARWGIGATELAELIDAEGQSTGYKVGGPVTARLLASYSRSAEVPFCDVAVSAGSMPWPLQNATQLKGTGYLLVCATPGELGSAQLVILNPRWVDWLANTNASILNTGRKMGLKLV